MAKAGALHHREMIASDQELRSSFQYISIKVAIKNNCKRVRRLRSSIVVLCLAKKFYIPSHKRIFNIVKNYPPVDKALVTAALPAKKIHLTIIFLNTIK